jgi:hypothetical protein|tara:strand:- start:552 stop:842 length:291 start_codon:yes stop_codon:yes gene_type:complete
MSENKTIETQWQKFAEAAKLPQVTINKNGYEIRTELLGMAKDFVQTDYYAKWGQFETSIQKEGDELVTKVEMPVVPGVEQIMDTAQKFYDFVNQKK